LRVQVLRRILVLTLSRTTMTDRRTFLAALGSAALGGLAGLPGRLDAGGQVAPFPRIGLQLYTVRGEMKRDLEGTLARVAEIGYDEVEFAGYFGRSPAQVRGALAANRLTAPSTHVPFADLTGAWARTLDDAASVGHTFVTIPWLAPAERRTLDAWRRVADALDRGGQAARAAGLRLAYHNHDFELATIDGRVPLDVLVEGTDPELVSFELDLYWMVRAGHAPLDFLARHPGRVSMLHAKDSAGAPEHRMVDVGRGVIDFRAILERADLGGARHVFVEHDQPADPMASIRTSHRNLSRITRALPMRAPRPSPHDPR
jgi:sugar phosphate isomerase/epimerase